MSTAPPPVNRKSIDFLPLVPESAPFNEAQRSWLNGFLAGWLGINGDASTFQPDIGARILNDATETSPPEKSDDDEAPPWHDPAIALNERLRLAEDRPLADRLMSTMAQLDCGACGYLCRTYSQAIAEGRESNLTLCSPGGAPTRAAIRKLMQTAPSLSTGDSDATKANITASVAPLQATLATSARVMLPAKLKSKNTLNQPGSHKVTTHVVLDVSHLSLDYQVGDSLGVLPRNCPTLVQQIVAELPHEPSDELTTTNRLELVERLYHCELRNVSDGLVSRLAESADDVNRREALQAIRDNGTELDVLELLRSCPLAGRPKLSDLVQVLTPLQPRLYSISSSPRAHDKEIHLTVARVADNIRGRVRNGVASTWFSDRLQPNDDVTVFVQKSHGFCLPADPRTAIVMIGPGTGIAPFRAFLHERAAQGATGDNWLFFGDQHEATDFLYRDELAQLQQLNVLTRLDTAFSRDQERKIYVQDRLREQGAELFRWLEAGASIYVCGDARRMAADVDRALHEVVSTHGSLSMEDAKSYVNNLKKCGRYCRDVY